MRFNSDLTQISGSKNNGWSLWSRDLNINMWFCLRNYIFSQIYYWSIRLKKQNKLNFFVLTLSSPKLAQWVGGVLYLWQSSKNNRSFLSPSLTGLGDSQIMGYRQGKRFDGTKGSFSSSNISPIFIQIYIPIVADPQPAVCLSGLNIFSLKTLLAQKGVQVLIVIISLPQLSWICCSITNTTKGNKTYVCMWMSKGEREVKDWVGPCVWQSNREDRIGHL